LLLVFPFARYVKKMGLKLKEDILSPEITSENGILVNTVAGFEYPFEQMPGIHVIGPCISKIFDRSVYDKWLDEHETVVYVGLGSILRLDRVTIDNFLTTFKQVNEHYDCAFYLKIGKGVVYDNVLGQIPDNVKLVDYVECQLSVLAHPNVKVFVSHCGGNSVHEGLYFGKPILGIPQWTDCYDFAQRLEDSGAGLRVQQTVPTINPTEVSTKLLQLLQGKSYIKRALDLQKLMYHAGGAEAAVNIISRKLLEAKNQHVFERK